MKRAVYLGVVLLFGVILTGCGGGGSSKSGTIVETPQSSTVTLADSLTLTLKVNTTQVAVGGSVNSEVILSNNTSAAITTTYYGYGTNFLAFPAGGVMVTNSAGQTMATNGTVQLALPLPAPMPITVTMQPGETMPVSVTYTFIKADTYTMLAEVSPTLGAPETTGSIPIKVP